MRGCEGLYWKDIGLQAAGYTWDYFAPQILEEDFVVTDGAIVSGGPRISGADRVSGGNASLLREKLLRLAGEGQKILFVNGVTEENLPLGGCTFHKKAASRTPYVMESDEKLRRLSPRSRNFRA